MRTRGSEIAARAIVISRSSECPFRVIGASQTRSADIRSAPLALMARLKKCIAREMQEYRQFIISESASTARTRAISYVSLFSTPLPFSVRALILRALRGDGQFDSLHNIRRVGVGRAPAYCEFTELSEAVKRASTALGSLTRFRKHEARAVLVEIRSCICAS